jgi:serine/threonine protein kinase
MNATKQDLSGTIVLGRYRIVQLLARGGMGVVYLARTEGAKGFTRPVIIKRIIPDLAQDEAAAQAFVREARILANLQHPGIVNVIDFDEEDGAYVMVLEYVHGYNIGQWHRYVVDTRGKMPIDHACSTRSTTRTRS